MTTESFDPRKGFEIVPAFLVIILVIVKCIAYLSPYIAAFSTDQQAVGLISSIAADETYNIILGMSITFWFGKKVGESQK